MAQDIADKVAKLLALAEGTSNPAEAEAFTEKAEELMLRYGIEQAEIAARAPGSKADPIIIERTYINDTYEAAKVTYGYAIAPSFNCKSYQSKSHDGKGHYIWMVGHTSDVEQAVILLKSLLVQSEVAMRYWWNTGGRASVEFKGRAQQKLARRQFMFAFGSGVRERLSEVRNRVVEDSSVGTELVLRDRNKMVEDWVGNNMTFGKGRARSLKGGAIEAGRAGFQAGREAVGTKAVTS